MKEVWGQSVPQPCGRMKLKTRLHRPVDILWCSNQRGRRNGNGWRFPPKVAKFLQAQFAGQSVLHLFGGQAQFGTRLDIDRSLRPDVIGDAFVVPFKRDSFDVVILDPPYVTLQAQVKIALFTNAAWIAHRSVVWFHTIWVASAARCSLNHSYLVRVGDQHHVRCLQIFDAPDPARKLSPPTHFTRGPAIKYNRWLVDQARLPFGVQGDAHERLVVADPR